MVAFSSGVSKLTDGLSIESYILVFVFAKTGQAALEPQAMLHFRTIAPVFQASVFVGEVN